MSEITEEQIRTLIAQFRELAIQTEIQDSEQLARTWFVQEESFHNDWDILMPEIKDMWTRVASAALREIETGEPTPRE